MHIIELGGPAITTIKRVSAPEPGPVGHGQALVRMRAAAFNYLDRLVATGGYPGALYPNVPVADGAGEVIAIGDGVESVHVGDRVAVHPKALWIAGAGTVRNNGAMRGVTIPGSLVELALVDAASLVVGPAHLGFEAIASLPIPATTGWNALRAGDIGPGSTVVLPGTGVTALQTLQLAKAAGARVIVTSSSDEKLDRARSLGADEGINYRAIPEWQDEVLRLTDGVGADLVLETTGADTFARSLAAVRHGGTVYAIGFVSGRDTPLDVLTVIGKAIRLIGGNTGSAADFRAATNAIAAHGIEPVIARTFGVGDIAGAYAALLAGEQFGKIAITLDW
jgi:NADPH:quinone reductase-like Zn-dependent oxidoreductase